MQLNIPNTAGKMQVNNAYNYKYIANKFQVLIMVIKPLF